MHPVSISPPHDVILRDDKGGAIIAAKELVGMFVGQELFGRRIATQLLAQHNLRSRDVHLVVAQMPGHTIHGIEHHRTVRKIFQGFDRVGVRDG